MGRGDAAEAGSLAKSQEQDVLKATSNYKVCWLLHFCQQRIMWSRKELHAKSVEHHADIVHSEQGAPVPPVVPSSMFSARSINALEFN